jgi:Protein of unknown function (DUF3105)
VAGRREHKERLRQEREERERQARAAAQRKQMVGYGAGGVLALAVVIVAVVLMTGGGGGGGASDAKAAEVFPDGGSVPDQRVFDVEPAADAAGCRTTTLKSRGQRDRLHTSGPDVQVSYRSNPPTLGRHWPPGYQAEDGLYGDAPADEALVHTMEHGRVIVWAKPSLPEDARKSLRALFEEDSYQLVLTPRSDMPYAVAATAWDADPAPGGTGVTLGCAKWTDEAIDAVRAFRDEHRSQGPEPVP